MSDFTRRAEGRLAELAALHRLRRLRLPEGVSFSHNDYLGLASHPEIVEAGKRALDRYGAGSRGSRLLGGHGPVFEKAEAAVAEAFQAPTALFFSSGYLANLAVVTALGRLADTLVSDEKNHASLIDAIRLTGKPRRIVPHQKWREDVPGEGLELLVAESLYGMDGDTVDWTALQDRLARGRAFLVLDEAHAAGVFGATGAGVTEGARDWEKMAVTVTFGKAFGVGGAAVLGAPWLRDLLINDARSFIYTTAPPPVVPAMVEAALDVARREGWRRDEIRRRAAEFRDVLGTGAPDRIPRYPGALDPFSPVIPFLVSGDNLALQFSESMRDFGVELRAIRYPTVPRGGERVRISLSLSVDRTRTLSLAKELVERWKVFSLRESTPV